LFRCIQEYSDSQLLSLLASVTRDEALLNEAVEKYNISVTRASGASAAGPGGFGLTRGFHFSSRQG
jgi:hypothetical protein